MSKPNFFIVGAAKSGTTSLWVYLQQHPEIFMPAAIQDKEPSYFCENYGCEDFQAYLSLFKAAGGCKAVGEASHVYLTSFESAAWIHREIPDAKIIMILRNPVDRAYSLYRWMVNNGYEWVYPFESALDVESDRMSSKTFSTANPEYFYDYLYYESGRYADQIERYLKVFPSDQVKFLLLDDLKQNPLESVQSIYSFLGVDSDFMPTIKVHNTSEYRPLFVNMHFFLGQAKRKFRNTRKGTVTGYLFDKNIDLFRLNWLAMRSDTKRTLTAKYRNDLIRVSQMIDRNLENWMAS